MNTKLMNIALLTLALGVTSCASSKKAEEKKDTPAVVQNDAKGDNNPGNLSGIEVNADSDSGKAGALQTVYFDFNSAELKGETKSALDNNAQFLKSTKAVKVQIEGHCDERGGVQYNLALGEKRAQVVKKYLANLGVEDNRMTTISFGKEKPVAFGHDDESWSKNRRANFVITAK